MDALKSLVQPLVGSAGSSSMIDGMKLVLLGGTVETARRVSSSAWSHFVNSFFLTAHFSEDEYPYDWLMLWLSRRPEWQRSREFETTTRSTMPGFVSQVPDNSFADDEEENDEELHPGKVKTRVVFQPTFDTTHTIYYKGHWLRVSRGRKTDGNEVLSISVIARNNAILKQLVLQAKREYETEAVHQVQIYFADSHGNWRWTHSRHKRPMSSIVLNPGVKEMLLSDTRDFLKSEKWYADRGIPFRRGYLLHGVPGSGKSSLIHALAGELMLDVYVVSLSASWMSDSTLTTLMGRVPSRCILLLEDLDAAFTRSVTRGNADTGTPNTNANGEETQDSNKSGTPTSGRRRRDKEGLSDVNTLTLSGLLNALDGVAAAEGRLLFATTNHLERLDPALSRPGRMDVWVEFKNSSRWQAEALFRNFFPSTEEEEDADIALEGDIEGVDLPCPSSPQSTGNGSPMSTLWSVSSSFASSTTSLSSPPASVDGNKPIFSNDFGAKNKAYLPPPVEAEIIELRHSAKPLDADTLNQLAKKFADSMPEEEFSVAALQGYLLKYKSHPETAANEAAAWVLNERAMRERLRREKEERELKEKLEREKRKKELQQKEKVKTDLEKKEQEIAKLKAQLEDKDKVDTEKNTSSEAPPESGSGAVAEATTSTQELTKASDDDDESEESEEDLAPAGPSWSIFS